MKRLTEIADIALTDKGTVKDEGHAYTEFYNDIFEQYKNTGKKINILEIGVQTGASLKMFNMFFDYNCEIYALDIDLGKNTYHAENVHLYHVDQNSRQEIENFLANVNNIKFDIILDDGVPRQASSRWPPIRGFLWPALPNYWRQIVATSTRLQPKEQVASCP